MRFSLNYLFFFSSRRRHTRYIGDWSSDVCSSDLHCRVVAQMTFDVYMAHYTAVADASPVPVVKIGRASCRERVWMWVVAVSWKKKQRSVQLRWSSHAILTPSS